MRLPSNSSDVTDIAGGLGFALGVGALGTDICHTVGFSWSFPLRPFETLSIHDSNLLSWTL